jgi:hypothetical protein
MTRHIEEKVMKEVSEKTNRDISLSYDSFYSGEMRSFYKKLVIDGTETSHHVDLFWLQEASSRGKLHEEIKRLTGIVLLG